MLGEITVTAESEREPFVDIAGILREFAGYLEKVRLPEAARADEEFARELRAGASRGRLRWPHRCCGIR